MKLYQSGGPNPKVVLLYLAEAGIELEKVEVDAMSGANREAPYITEINTLGQLPALQLDNGDVITEVTAICEYLDELNGGSSLIGSTAQERAETRMWLRRVDLNICDDAANYTRYNPDIALEFFKNRVVCIPEAINGMKKKLERNLDWLNKELEGKAYLCGERFSLADIFLFPFIADLSPGMPFLLSEERPEIQRWYDSVQLRDSVAQLNS